MRRCRTISARLSTRKPTAYVSKARSFAELSAVFPTRAVVGKFERSAHPPSSVKVSSHEGGRRPVPQFDESVIVGTDHVDDPDASRPLVDQIAAGRSSNARQALKELVENALGRAGRIRRWFAAWTRSSTSMTAGMSKDDLALAIRRHPSNSRQPAGRCRFLGFRGRLFRPSVPFPSCNHLGHRGERHAWQIRVDAGSVSAAARSSRSRARVEVTSCSRPFQRA